MPDATTVQFVLEAQMGEQPIRGNDTRELWNATRALLNEVEQFITGESAQAHWDWADDYHMPLVASANGVNYSTLETIAVTARELLGRTQSGEMVAVTPGLEGARKAANRILRILDRVEAIVVRTDDGEETRIDSAVISERVGKQKVRRVYSSVEGHLAMLSDRGSYIAGRIIEHSSGRSILARFSPDLADSVSTMFKHNVLAYGMVAYDGGGYPTSIVEIREIEQRDRNVSLAESIDTARSLIGPMGLDEILELMRPSD